MIGRGDKVMPFVSESEKFIEPMPERMVIGGSSQVPLANQPRRVSNIVKAFSQGFFTQRESGSGIFVACPDVIGLVPEASGNTAGKQAGSRWAAVRCRDIGLSASNTIGSDRIDMRRWNLQVALAAQLPITQVVSQ